MELFFGISILLLLLCPNVMGLPHAIVHIGPHKTASTHIQNELVFLRKQLAPVNYYWPTHGPSTPGTAKSISIYPMALKGVVNNPENVIAHMRHLFQEFLALNRSIVLSSEGFDNMNRTEVTALRDHLKGFNVTVVFVYREFIGQFISRHFQSNRFEGGYVNFSKSFSGWLFRMMDNLLPSLDPIRMLQTYTEVFGIENIRIIDLLGTMAAKTPLTRVFLCEIAGVLCNYSGYAPMMKTNAAYSLLPAQVFSFYKSFVERQNNGTCRICGSNNMMKEYIHFAERYKNQTFLHAPPVTVKTKLSMLLPYARMVDTEVRTIYRANILHSNQSANFESMQSHQVEEIDPELFD